LCKPIKIRTSHILEEEEKGAKSRPLTVPQAKAVQFRDGVAIVVAPAGSGKTFALVERVNELVKSGVDPERILMFTFTKKAAAEMAERITTEKKPKISTIHAFCFDIIQDNAIFFGKNLELETNAERESVLAELLNTRPEVIEGLRYDIDGQYGALSMADKHVMSIRERGVKAFLRTSTFSDEKNGQLIELAKETVKALRQRGLITFDDMISLVNDLFAERPQLVSQLADYDYIMVDEFQDTSADQYQLIKTIASVKGNLMVVGDDDQSIYGFRGGDSKFFRELKKDFPQAEEIFFEDNFRSSQMICDTAKLFVEKNEGRIKKKISGNRENGVGALPVYYKDADTSLLLTSVQKLMEKRKASDIAVITRNNKEANEVCEVLGSADIQCSAPKDYLKDDAVFKIISSLLTYYIQPSNDMALAYLLKFLGVATFPEKSNHSESYEYNLRVNGNEQTRLAMLRLESATEAMDEVKKISDGLPKVAKMIGLPTEHPVYSALLTMCGEKNVGEWEGLQKLCTEVSAHGDLVRVGYPPLENEIQVLTAHDSKGLQFDAVIIWRTECFSLDSEDGEDRNLMYVASTRAKNTLIYMESPKTRPGEVDFSRELEGHVQMKKWKGGF
jgi:DNA helicase-2/ATP-dependent DNA helicase PcrA